MNKTENLHKMSNFQTIQKLSSDVGVDATYIRTMIKKIYPTRHLC